MSFADRRSFLGWLTNLVGVVIAAILTVPPAPAQPAPREEAIAATPAPAQLSSAETSERMTLAATQYQQYCLVCHGADGRGVALGAGMPTIPDLTDPQWQSSRTDARLVVGILDGYGRLMPPFRDHLTRPQSQALAAYVRAFGPQKRPVEGPIATGDLDERMQQLQDQWRELERQIKGLPQ